MTGADATLGDRLVALIGAADTSPDRAGEAAYELLQLLYGGYPVERLRPLANAGPEAAGSLAWLASELSTASRPLLDDLVPLLDSPEPRTRYHVVEAVLLAATPAEADSVAAAVARVRDDHEAVRWCAGGLLARVDEDVLAAALPLVASTDLQALVAWLLHQKSAADGPEVSARVDDPDEAVRIVAVAAAVRLLDRTPDPLAHAEASPDPAVHDFAARQRVISQHIRRRS